MFRWSQKSGTGINPRKGITSSRFQRLIENEEDNYYILSVVRISWPPD
jgi:hypothetical protein